MHMNKTLLTLLVGIGIGVLIAPDKGSATIKKMKSRFDGLKDQARDGVDDLADNAKDAINSGRSKVNSILD
jgi:gas vesicle protein